MSSHSQRPGFSVLYDLAVETLGQGSVIYRVYSPRVSTMSRRPGNNGLPRGGRPISLLHDDWQHALDNSLFYGVKLCLR